MRRRRQWSLHMLSLMLTVQLKTGNTTHGREGHQLRLEKIWEKEPRKSTNIRRKQRTFWKWRQQEDKETRNRKARQKSVATPLKSREKHFQKEEDSVA